MARLRCVCGTRSLQVTGSKPVAFWLLAETAVSGYCAPENSGRLQNQQDTVRLCNIATWMNSPVDGVFADHGPSAFGISLDNASTGTGVSSACSFVAFIT